VYSGLKCILSSLSQDNPLPYGGIDGTWGSRHLFTCEPKHGLLVPITKTIKECDLYQWSKEDIGKLAIQLL
jgi:hypothetical protein